MGAKIIGIGSALPPYSVSQQDSLARARLLCCTDEHQARVLEHLYNKTTIENRACVVLAPHKESGLQFFAERAKSSDTGPTTAERMRRYAEDAPPLATRACLAALGSADINASTVTHLITVSCSGFSAPGFDLALFETLCLQPSVYRTHLGFMGCHGALNALRVAEGFIASAPTAVVLVCALEICSLHFQYGWNSDNLVANSLFADGAAAMVLSSEKNLEHSRRKQMASYASSRSHVIAGSQKSMTWTIGDNGFSMTLGSEVPALIENNIKDFIDVWLAENDLSISSIGGWAVHPGGPRILDAVEKTLGLRSQDLLHSRAILSECGNMSSPTVLFILERMFKENIPRPFVILGFGPGLTIEAALIS